MQARSGKELREMFLSFFESKGHKRYPSFSLVPDDPSILFTIAGMVPFKPYFLGQKTPEVTRATTSQKCVRTNDIDNVGRTARHHTFFEMLGNFSFGDYFKKEASLFAWEFLTERVGLDPDRLYPTIYKDDEEAFEIWNKVVGVPANRIYRLGEEDNFWSVGPVGPCGPCSELIYDQGPEFSCGSPDCGLECDCDRYLEVWNLVFMQYNRDEEGNLNPLPKKNIDTGMGLERLASVVQQVKGDFETDLFKPLVAKASSIMGVKYGSGGREDMAVRVVSDHLRAVAFMIADGIMPSNEGRGYVLRRILRRAVRYGRLAGVERPFLTELLPVLNEIMADPYEELILHKNLIEQVIEQEELRFGRTLEQGTTLLEEEIRNVKGSGGKTLSGVVAFELYDTFGFPFELTEEICKEAGIEVKFEEFQKEMEKQRERARAAWAKSESNKIEMDEGLLKDLEPSEFTGYEKEEDEGKVLAVVVDNEKEEACAEGQECYVVLNKTPFYGEKGGQVGDEGVLEWQPGGRAKVLDTQVSSGGHYVHKVRVESGKLKVGDFVVAKVDSGRRKKIKAHHTSTHLLHEALIRVLGDHVRQAGSLVAPDFLRFDFTHVKPMTKDEIKEVENIVFGVITDNLALETHITNIEEAKKLGAKALFEEKYGDKVRVIVVPGYSAELCGGTHVNRTGDIGVFKIVKEEGIGAGLRRITALASDAAFLKFQEQAEKLDELSEILEAEEGQLKEKALSLLEQRKKLQDEVERLNVEKAQLAVDEMLQKAVEVEGVLLCSGIFDELPPNVLRQVGDKIRNSRKSSVTILASKTKDQVTFVVMADKDAMAKGVHAGKLAKSIAQLLGGGGGGRPDVAQAGAKKVDGVKEALNKAIDILREMIG